MPNSNISWIPEIASRVVKIITRRNDNVRAGETKKAVYAKRAMFRNFPMAMAVALSRRNVPTKMIPAIMPMEMFRFLSSRFG
jgi:hypothetical protein